MATGGTGSATDLSPTRALEHRQDGESGHRHGHEPECRRRQPRVDPGQSVVSHHVRVTAKRSHEWQHQEQQDGVEGLR
jgi:hypothetical protein